MRHAGDRAGRAAGPSGCGSRPSTRPACASCGPTATASATRVLHHLRRRRLAPPDRDRLPRAGHRHQEAVAPVDPRPDQPGQGRPAGTSRRTASGPRRPSSTAGSPTSSTLYQQRMVAANAMDFDDLLLNTVHLFRACDDVLEHYRTASPTSWSTSTRTPTGPRTRWSCCSAGRTATSWWWGTATSRSTGSAAPTSATSSTSSRPSPTPPPSPSTRTSAPPRPSSTRPTR